MAKPLKKPSNLLEAIVYFSDLDVATKYVADLRWPNGPVCPRCGSTEHSYVSTRRIWKCKACKRQFSVKVGTIFEDSALGLDKWLPAIWLAANSKNGISSHELARSLGTTQKSAWFMLHRIREAMRRGSIERFVGHVEVDETYVGGKALKMNARRRARGIEKTAVIGAVERGGEVRTEVLTTTGHEEMRDHVVINVDQAAIVYTDAHRAYSSLWEYGYGHHRVINHDTAYVDGSTHINTIENFWSVLKRALYGTHVSVDPEHLCRYLDERTLVYNLRKLTDYERFAAVLGTAFGRRLTWLDLTT
jgi:transposase-like protein